MYEYLSSLLLASCSCAIETRLTSTFWLYCCCCCWYGLVLDLVRHIFAKWFGFPHFWQVFSSAGHEPVLWGRASPHWWHVLDRICWDFAPRGLVCLSWWTKLASSDVRERLFSIIVACHSPTSNLRALAGRFSRVRASSWSEYLWIKWFWLAVSYDYSFDLFE